jgi:hypothetical protein
MFDDDEPEYVSQLTRVIAWLTIPSVEASRQWESKQMSDNGEDRQAPQMRPLTALV